MVLARLAGVLARLTESSVAAPACRDCRRPMALRREDAVGAFVMEQVYSCDRCGRHLTRVHPVAIPD